MLNAIVIGLAIGFIGYLPLGNINLTVVQMALNRPIAHVIRFIILVAFFEFVYCYLCMKGMSWLVTQQDLILFLKWATVVVFSLLGVLALYQGFKQRNGHLVSTEHVMRKGILIAILNPFQIPFWIVWGLYLLQDNLINKNEPYLFIFALFTSFGTIAVLTLYGYLGKYLVERLKINQSALNLFIGVLLIVLAIIQAVKLL